MPRSRWPALALLLSAACAVTPAETAPLNVVFILVDDLGWADIGANNPDCFYPTPRIDDETRPWLIQVDGLSKNFRRTGGLRIGWAVGPDDVIGSIINVQSHYTSGPATPTQAAALFGEENHADYSAVTSGELAVLDEAASAHRRFGRPTIPHYVISMAESVSDVLEVAVLLKEVGLVRIDDGRLTSALDIVPLFESE